MSLEDRFRIDELVQKGSKAIPRDFSGGITVHKKSGKEIKKPISREIKPYGTEPIRPPQSQPKLKTDLLEPSPVQNVEQTSFSGETSGYLERPVYDEAELKKAVDVKVDELIKPKKVQKGEFVPKPRYDRLQEQYNEAQNKIRDLSAKVAALESVVQSQRSEINSLAAQLESVTAQLLDKQKELDALLARYNALLGDFQNSIIRGTKEGIERVSLAAQVKGLQAQKETLQAQLRAQQAQLQAQQDIVKSLQQQSEIQAQQVQIQQQIAEDKLEATKKGNLLDIVGSRKHFEVKGNIAWASAESNKNIKPEFPIAYDDRKKDPRGVLSGMKIEFYNISEEAVTLNVSTVATRGVKWLNGVPTSLTIPKSPDGGSSPGMTTLTFSRNNSAGKGNHDNTIKLKNSSTGDELKIEARYWQARSRRST